MFRLFRELLKVISIILAVYDYDINNYRPRERQLSIAKKIVVDYEEGNYRRLGKQLSTARNKQYNFQGKAILAKRHVQSMSMPFYF